MSQTAASPKPSQSLDDLITVCAACKQASCWQGIFMCQKAQYADTMQMTRRDLLRLRLEHPCYLKTDAALAAE